MGNNKHLSMKFVFSSLCIFLALSCIIPGAYAAFTAAATVTVNFPELSSAAAYDQEKQVAYQLGVAVAYGSGPSFSLKTDGKYSFAAGVKVCSKAGSVNAAKGFPVTFTAYSEASKYTGPGVKSADHPDVEMLMNSINLVVNANGIGKPPLTSGDATKYVFITPSKEDAKITAVADTTANCPAAAGSDAAAKGGSAADAADDSTKKTLEDITLTQKVTFKKIEKKAYTGDVMAQYNIGFVLAYSNKGFTVGDDKSKLVTKVDGKQVVNTAVTVSSTAARRSVDVTFALKFRGSSKDSAGEGLATPTNTELVAAIKTAITDNKKGGTIPSADDVTVAKPVDKAAKAATPKANGTSSASCTGQFSLAALSIPVVAMVISKM